MPEGKVFVDTNILVYAYDISANKKHQIAKKLLVDLWNSNQGVVSIQVLQEFFVVVTSKVARPLDIQLTKTILSDLLKWDVVINDEELLIGAIELHQQYKYSFWDSLVVQAAITSGATLLLSEDLAHEHTISGLKIKNPFR